MNKKAKTLSGGMQRRLNIALALIHDPEIIILDEPQAGLDSQSRILVRDFIRQLAKEKAGMGDVLQVRINEANKNKIDWLMDSIPPEFTEKKYSD